MNHCTYHVSDLVQFKTKMLGWVKQFNIFCFLDSCNYTIAPQRFQWLLAAGVQTEATANLHHLDQFVATPGQWKFGHLGYELKNSLHDIPASAHNKVGFPGFYFFVPQIVLEFDDDKLIIHADEPEAIYQAIQNHEPITGEPAPNALTPRSRISKEQYIDCIHKLQKHIARGDCYEINFCVEFFCDDVLPDPLTAFKRLQQISPNPFSAFYKWNDSYLLCASPERFLCRKNDKLFSQPIKGTIERDRDNVARDEDLKKQLSVSKKDQAENVMVVDLVRNDLSRICQDDSVKVDELFGIYTFPQVHQMISTISGTIKERISFSEILKATFPMGSMTGAPKHRVMELIDEYETGSRGIFSGAVGYFSPDGDFDFNVVIRSIMYNAANKYLSYQVGSGITFYSNAEDEWNECLLKAEAMREVLDSAQ